MWKTLLEIKDKKDLESWFVANLAMQISRNNITETEGLQALENVKDILADPQDTPGC